MKKLTLLFLALSFFGKAQNIEILTDTLSFPKTDELTINIEFIELYNPGPYVLEISNISSFKIYGNFPYSLSKGQFFVQPFDTLKVPILFQPEHNIKNNLPCIVETASGFGHQIVYLEGQGEYSKSYYSTTENKSGSALKTALSNRISQNYNSLSYNVARDSMYASIDNSGGSVECVYTGRTANFTTRSGANSNQFNCEHTFPQGKFNSASPMKSDIHHLFPTDVQANSERGNKPFGTVSNAAWTQGGSKSNNATFEPRDIQKGATARAMMYFVLRYQDYTNFFAGQETILKNWHQNYPPNASEKTRNDDIFSLQNNRNPFVDYPQFSERIPSLVNNSSFPDNYDLYFADDTIQLADVSGRHFYNAVFYNNGNKDVTISNFTFSDTSLYLKSGTPNSITIAPQQVEVLEISFNGNVNYNADFEYDTDVPNSSRQVVTIRSGTGIGLEERWIFNVSVYPNPADNFITISADFDIEKVRVWNSSGEEFLLKMENEKMDINRFPKGFYLMEIVGENGEVVLKKWVKN